MWQTEISGNYNSPLYLCFLYLFFLSLFLPEGSVYWFKFKIWYSRFYWFRSTKDPADPHSGLSLQAHRATRPWQNLTLTLCWQKPCNFYNPNRNLRDNIKKNSSQDIFKYSHFRLFTTLYLQTTVSRFRQDLFRWLIMQIIAFLTAKHCLQRPTKRKKLVALDIIVKRNLLCKLDPLRYLN